LARLAKGLIANMPFTKREAMPGAVFTAAVINHFAMNSNLNYDLKTHGAEKFKI
jgi:shikimate kinase